MCTHHPLSYCLEGGGWADANDGDLAAQTGYVKGVSSAATEEVEAVEALPEAVEVALTRGNVEVAPAKEDTKPI